MKYWVGILGLIFTFAAVADEVEIVMTKFVKESNGWRVDTTLRHDDTGWDNYADAWRIVDEKGKVIGERTLFHPHEDEQPFTRSLNNVIIPDNVKIVYVEAHDKVLGWSKQKVKVDLTKKEGERFKVVK